MSNSSLIFQAPPAGWYLSLYPAAGEGGGCFRPTLRPRSDGPRDGVGDPERSRAEAARRARARLRRYCVANELTRLGTLTYGPPSCTDPGQARLDVGVFFRRLRSELGGAAFPYAWVPEFHKDQERLHLHFAAGRYIKRSVIEEAWGHGFVHIKLLSDVAVGTGRRGEARRAAGYLSKYVSKSFADQRLKGRHRYDVAQGFAPQMVEVWGRSARDVLGQASDLLGQRGPIRAWFSDEQPDWHGPPAVWAQWS